jgi:tricarballylate dehydrogenase
VRGTRNTGDDPHGARRGRCRDGQLVGCHASPGTATRPDGDPAVGDGFQKHSYPGACTSTPRAAFVDEGADFATTPTPSTGGDPAAAEAVRRQIFDAKVKAQLRRVPHPQVTRITGNTLQELVAKMDDTNQEVALQKSKYNAAVRTDIPLIRT